jgi:molecular chaperone GrpE
MNTQSKSGDNMATIQVTRELLQVLDTYDRAFGSVTAESESDKSIVDEYKKAYDMILETFKKLGVVEVATVGTEFNYELHQAVMQKPSEEFEEGFVSEELQKGFKIGDELVRAAMVVVAA